MRFLLGVLLLCIGQVTYAEVKLSQDMQSIDIQTHLLVIDTEPTKTLRDMRFHPHWRNASQYVPANTVWAKLAIEHQLPQAMPWYLAIGNRELDIIDVFLLDTLGRIVQSERLGQSRQNHTMSHYYAEHVVPLQLAPNEKYTLFIKFTDSSDVKFNGKIWQPESYNRHHQRQVLVSAMIAGALLIMVVYFLVTYMVLHRPVRFWFACACMTALGFYLGQSGLINTLLEVDIPIKTITLVLFAIMYLCIAKVLQIIQPFPLFLYRITSYGFAITICISAFVLIREFQVVAATVLSILFLLMHAGAGLYNKSLIKSLDVKCYILSLYALFGIICFDIYMSLSGIVFSNWVNISMAALVLSTFIGQAIAVEIYERKVDTINAQGSQLD